MVASGGEEEVVEVITTASGRVVVVVGVVDTAEEVEEETSTSGEVEDTWTDVVEVVELGGMEVVEDNDLHSEAGLTTTGLSKNSDQDTSS